MAQFKPRQSHAERRRRTVAILRENGRHDLIKPMESHRVDHHRPGDGYRETVKYKGPNGKQWKGVRGKQKKTRQCNS